MKLQLFIDNKEILATDGTMIVDGRFSIYSITNAVRERNEKFAKNFPHKVCDGFAIYKGDKISNGYGVQYKL